MTDVTVPGQYASITAALAYFAGLGNLTGTGENQIQVSAGTYAEDLNTPGLTTDATGYVVVVGMGATPDQVIIETTLGVDLNDSNAGAATYNGLRNVLVRPSATMAAASDTVSSLGHTFVEKGIINNPNSRDVNGFRGAESGSQYAKLEDCRIYGFTGNYRRGVSSGGTQVRCTLHNNYNNGHIGNFTDCVATGSNAGGADFGGGTTTTNCASSDETATGTNCITAINPAVEFVDAANDDFRLAGGSQLIGAGSTGNNIGWFQSPSITLVDDDDDMQPGQTDVLITTSNFPASVTSLNDIVIGGTSDGSTITGGTSMLNQRWNNGQPLIDIPGGMALGSTFDVHVDYTE